MWVMNINSIPQRRRGIGSSVILSPQMSMQVNKQMHGTRINGARNRRGERDRMRRDGARKGTVVPKKDFTNRAFWYVTENWFE